jgi:transposase-like protein
MNEQAAPPELPQLTEQQVYAARLLGEARETTEAIAAKIGVTDRTLRRWKHDPGFQKAVQEFGEEWRREARTDGLADPDWRMRELQDQYLRVKRAIERRANSEGMAAVPGGDSGMVTVSYKMLARVDDEGNRISEPVPEYAIDTATSAEMRAILQQAAVERGQWKAPQQTQTINLSVILGRKLDAAEKRLAEHDEREKNRKP